MIYRTIMALLFMGALAGCGATAASTATSSADGTIEISGAWVRPMEGMGAMDAGNANGMDMSGFSSAAYMTIRNTGSSADRLLKAASDAATTVELHNNTNTNGVMSMGDVQAVDVAAGSTVEFKPEGLHMMLVGLKHDLKAGDTVALSLQFEKAGTVKVNVTVRDQ
jgi:copper(I)-binding protein